jgi:four helix bundle protein
MRTHKDLDVWKVSMEFVTEIYEITKDFPKSELFGLSSQIRRAAVSIPANISEGSARQTSKEFNQFLHIALGSASELHTLITIAYNLKYIKEIDKLEDKLTRISKMISGLIKSLVK